MTAFTDWTKAKSKYTVPTLVKQLKTGKVTAKLLVTLQTLLASSNDECEAFIKAEGYETLIPIPDVSALETELTLQKENDYKEKADEIRIEIINIVAASIKHYAVAEHFLDPNNGILLQRYDNVNARVKRPLESYGGQELHSLRLRRTFIAS